MGVYRLWPPNQPEKSTHFAHAQVQIFTANHVQNTLSTAGNFITRSGWSMKRPLLKKERVQAILRGALLEML